MPSSGHAYGTVGGDGEFSYLDWQVVSQDVALNRSTIAWQAGWLFNTNSCRGLRNAQAIINGSTVYSDFAAGDHVHAYNPSHDHRPGTGNLQVASGTIQIAHNSDGTQTISTSITMTGFSGQVSAGSASESLPTIPRFSTAPSKPVLTEVTDFSVRVQFTDGTGGAPIDSRQIGYGITTDASDNFWDSDGDDVVDENLEAGDTYYFRARTHNAAGYSPWSEYETVTMLDVPDQMNTPEAQPMTQTTAVVTWVVPDSDGGSPIDHYTVGVNTVDDVETADYFDFDESPGLIEDLEPNTRYYFWVLATNDIGDSLWSESTFNETVAGAWVKVGAEWKRAVPWVKVAGVYKLAQPWVKVMGEWKETF